MVLADPPYGIDCVKTGAGANGFGGPFTVSGGAKIAGDTSVDGRWLSEAYRILRNGTALLSFSRWDVDREWHTAIEQAGFTVKNRLVWDKGVHGSGDLRGAHGCSHETCWRAVKGVSLLRTKRGGDVFKLRNRERDGKMHPFQKPVELLVKLILADTDPGDLVIDPYAGSGSTGVACVLTGRRFWGMEISEEFFETCVNRLRAELAGQKMRLAKTSRLAVQ